VNGAGIPRRSLFVIAGAALCTAGCGKNDEPQPASLPASTSAEGAGVRLEVDLYSGRPNPTADLGTEVADELRRRIAALQPVPDPTTSPSDRLGYRGLRATFTSADGPAEVFVSNGTVTVRNTTGGEQRLADPGRNLERWLIGAAAGDLGATEVAAVQAELNP
jgi:hypothetical protein